MKPLIPYFQHIKFELPMPGWLPKDHITIHAYGICVLLGLILGGMYAIQRAKRLGLDYKAMYNAFLLIAVGIVVGGHIGYGLFYKPQEYFENPIKFIYLWEGMSSFGGFIFCLIIMIYFFRKKKLTLWPYFDCVSIGFTLGWFFARLGCTINHEHPGTPSNFFLARYCRPVDGWTIELPLWMVDTPKDFRWSHCIENGKATVNSIAEKVSTGYEGVLAVHDTGFYEALYAIILFGIFLWLDRKPRFHGFYGITLVSTYTPIRFFMDFIRPLEGNVRYVGLTPAQWGCIVFLALCVYGYQNIVKLNVNIDSVEMLQKKIKGNEKNNKE